MNLRSDPSSCRRRAVTISRPRCHVVSRTNTIAAINSGSHAPCPILVELAARKSRSTISRKPRPRATRQSGHRH